MLLDIGNWILYNGHLCQIASISDDFIKPYDDIYTNEFNKHHKKYKVGDFKKRRLKVKYLCTIKGKMLDKFKCAFVADTAAKSVTDKQYELIENIKLNQVDKYKQFQVFNEWLKDEESIFQTFYLTLPTGKEFSEGILALKNIFKILLPQYTYKKFIQTIKKDDFGFNVEEFKTDKRIKDNYDIELNLISQYGMMKGTEQIFDKFSIVPYYPLDSSNSNMVEQFEERMEILNKCY